MSAPTIQGLSRDWVLGIARRQRSVKAEHDQALAALDRRSRLTEESAAEITSVGSGDPGYREAFARAFDTQRAQLAESRVGIDAKFDAQQRQLEREWAAVEDREGHGARVAAERAVLADDRQEAAIAREAAADRLAACQEGPGGRAYYQSELLAAQERELTLAREAAELELRVASGPIQCQAAELELRGVEEREAALAREVAEQRLVADQRRDALADKFVEPEERVGTKLSEASSHEVVGRGGDVVAEPRDLEPGEKRSGTPWSAILAAGCAAVVVCALLFVPHSPANVVGNKNPKNDPGANDSDAKDAFAISGAHFWDIHESLGAGSLPSVGWAGGSSNSYATSNGRLGSIIESIVATNQDVDATVQAQAEQVDGGRRTLANSFNGLQLAMPVSESLYFSGPAGPALSCNFQLVLANGAVGSSAETTHAMHENSRKHGERLAVLEQQYAYAFGLVSATHSSPAIRASATVSPLGEG